MNIGFFTDTYTPLVDGVVRSILEFRKELEARGHTVYVFCPEVTKAGIEKYGEADPPDDKNVFRFTSVDSVFLPGYPLALPVSFKATRSIPKLHLDVVHCHTPVMVGLMGDLVAFLANVPKVYTYHTYYSEYSRVYILGGQDITPKMVESYERLYMNRSDTVITPSDKLATLMRGDYKYKGELEVIPTGLPSGLFDGITGDRFLDAFPQVRGKRMLFFAGRLGKEKNVSFLIRMMRELSDLSDVVLVIAGEGRHRKLLEKEAADLIPEGRVLFTKVLDRSMALSAFKAADLFVFSSLTDTQGLVLSEAVAAGTPIVMVDDPGVSYAVIPGKTAEVVPEDESVFAEKVKELLSDRDVYNKLVQGCNELIPSLAMDVSVDALERVYQHVVDEHAATSWRSRARVGLQKDIHLPAKVPGVKRGVVNIKKMVRGTRKFFGTPRD